MTRAAPLSRYGAIPGVEAAYPVLRSSASAGPAASVSGVTVLGVPGPAIRAMPLWRGDWGTSKDGLAEAVAPSGSTALQGVTLGGARLRVSRRPRPRVVPRDDRTARRLVPRSWISAARTATAPAVLSVALPAEARRGRLVSITLVPPRIIERGSDEGVALRGTTTLRVLDASLDGLAR